MKKNIKRSLGQLVEAAFRQAARAVIERAKQTGTPVIIWKDGEMKRVDPRKIRLPPDKKKRRSAGK